MRIVEHDDGFHTGVRNGVFEIIKIQATAILLLFVAGGRLLARLKISPMYLPLRHVQTIATGLQVLFLSILSMYFDPDRRTVVLARSLARLKDSTFVLQRGPDRMDRPSPDPSDRT